MHAEGAPAGRPAPSLAPHFPNPGDFGARLWRSGTEAARGRSPSPGAEVGQVLGKGKCRGRCLALRLPGGPPFVATFRAAKPLAAFKGQLLAWARRHLLQRGGGCLDQEARGRREEGGGREGKVCKGGILHDLGPKTWLEENSASVRPPPIPGSSVTKPRPLDPYPLP